MWYSKSVGPVLSKSMETGCGRSDLDIVDSDGGEGQDVHARFPQMGKSSSGLLSRSEFGMMCRKDAKAGAVGGEVSPFAFPHGLVKLEGVLDGHDARGEDVDVLVDGGVVHQEGPSQRNILMPY